MAESPMMCLPPQNGPHSLRHERVTSGNMDRSCRDARVQRAHSEDPSQGWSPTVGRPGVLLLGMAGKSEGKNGAIFGCQQCWTQGRREHSCLLSQALEPWNPLTSPMYMAMRPSQEDDSIERWPSKGSRVAQSTQTGSVVSCLQLTPATPHRDTSRGLN